MFFQFHLLSAGDDDLREDLFSRLEPRPRESRPPCREPDRDLTSDKLEKFHIVMSQNKYKNIDTT